MAWVRFSIVLKKAAQVVSMQVFYIALLAVTFGAVDNGGGIDIWNVRKTKYMRFIKVKLAFPLGCLD